MVKKKKESKGTTVTIVKEEGEQISGKSGMYNTKVSKIYERYKNSQSPGNYYRWWDVADKNKLYESVQSTVNFIEASQAPLRMTYLRYSRMYGNYSSVGFASSYRNNSLSYNAGPIGNNRRNAVFNVVQSCVDGVAAKIAKDQPKITFVTNGAEDFMKKVKATKLTKFVNGILKSAKVYENCESVFRDGAVLGTGYLKLFREEGKIKSEWVSPHEIVVDEIDGWKMAPRSMHQIKLISRDQLMIAYRDDEDKCALIKSSQSSIPGKIGVTSTTDMLEVIESWHLPANSNSGDGLHCITIDNGTLFYEEYTKDYFPIVPWRWMNNPLGFFGRSVTEEVADKQIEINSLMGQIKQSIELVGIPMILVPNDAEIPIDKIGSNYIARIIKYQGNMPPTVVTPVAQNPEVYSYLNSLISWCYQQVGLSEQSASGMKPAGVDSAVAIREVQDIETGRFAMVALRWEQLFVTYAKIIVDLCKEEYKENKDFSSKFIQDKTVRELKFSDVDLDNEDCDISVFPTSQLPDTPAGRIETIQEYTQAGWISKEKAMELMNLDPDLESEINLQTSNLQLFEDWLTQMAEDGVYHHPEPELDLQLALRYSQQVYALLVRQKCPEDRLELVRRFIGECQQLLTPPPAPPGPPQMGPDQGPPPAGGPPPMPNQPPQG